VLSLSERGGRRTTIIQSTRTDRGKVSYSMTRTMSIIKTDLPKMLTGENVAGASRKKS
jgi:hypothetical protein